MHELPVRDPSGIVNGGARGLLDSATRIAAPDYR